MATPASADLLVIARTVGQCVACYLDGYLANWCPHVLDAVRKAYARGVREGRRSDRMREAARAAEGAGHP